MKQPIALSIFVNNLKSTIFNMQGTNYSLPEFVFLNGNSYQGDTLKGRTVIQHFPSNTVMEVIEGDSILSLYFSESESYHFNYHNPDGFNDEHMLFLHFTYANKSVLNDIFKKTVIWYIDYLRWKDRNLKTDNQSTIN